jgi:hypothetical protein
MLHSGPSKQIPPVDKPDTIGHEEFIQGVRQLVCQARHLDTEVSSKVLNSKLTYGLGDPGTRGVTYFSAWQCGEKHVDFIGINATSEESVVQLAGTTIHELAHVVAGPSAGHGIAWKESCKLLGLMQAEAAGQAYIPEHFDMDLWERIKAFGQPQDGNPAFSKVGGLPFVGLPTAKPKPCPLGIGTRGGQSRGVGSGSRMRLYHCQCEPPVKVRHAGDDLACTCKHCGSDFNLQPRKGKD